MDRLETIGGHQRYTLHNGRIIVIEGSGDMGRVAVDAWTDLILDTLNHWHDHDPIMLLLDLSHPTQGLTPYTRIRVHEMLRQIDPQRGIVVALLFRDRVMKLVAALFLMRILPRVPLRLSHCTFTNREEAIQYLLQHQPPASAHS